MYQALDTKASGYFWLKPQEKPAYLLGLRGYSPVACGGLCSGHLLAARCRCIALSVVSLVHQIPAAGRRRQCSMDIIFTRSSDRWDQTVVRRGDGVSLSVPVFGPLAPIPHDLAHYVVEVELGLDDGFWGSVAAGAIFDGMRIIGGRQRPHAKERSRAVLAANQRGVLRAEVLVDVAVRAMKGEPLGDLALSAMLPLVRTQAEATALAQRLRPTLDVECACWQAVPMGGQYLVVWPEATTRSRRSTRRR